MNISKIEFSKLFRRVEFWCSWIILIVPIALFIGSMSDSSMAMAIETKSRFNSVVISLGFALQLGVYHLLFAILATNLLSVELNTNYSTLYFPHIRNKASLYTKKTLVINTVMILHTLVYILFSLGASYIMLTNMQGHSFIDKETIWYVLTIVASVLEFITFVNIILCTGLFLKPLQNIFLAITMFIARFLVYDIPVVGNIMPMKYIQELMNMENKGDLSILITNFFIVLVLSIIYNLSAQIIGRKTLRKYSQ